MHVLNLQTKTMLSLMLYFCVLKIAELDALEADMDVESNSVPPYLQPEKESDLDSELKLPAAPSDHAAAPNWSKYVSCQNVPNSL
jgi:hypothetical protein